MVQNACGKVMGVSPIGTHSVKPSNITHIGRHIGRQNQKFWPCQKHEDDIEGNGAHHRTNIMESSKGRGKFADT